MLEVSVVIWDLGSLTVLQVNDFGFLLLFMLLFLTAPGVYAYRGLKRRHKMQSIKSVRIIKYIVSGLGNPIKMSKVMTKLEREWKEVALSQETKREESYQKYKMND